MNSGDLVSPLLGGVVEGELSDAPWLLSGDDLQTFDHTCHTLKSKKKVCMFWCSQFYLLMSDSTYYLKFTWMKPSVLEQLTPHTLFMRIKRIKAASEAFIVTLPTNFHIKLSLQDKHTQTQCTISAPLSGWVIFVFDTQFNAGQISLCVHGKSPSSKKNCISFSCGLKTTVHPVPAVRRRRRRSVVYLVLQGAVFPLCLFADDDQVQVVVASAVARQAVDVNHVSKQVQFTPGEWTGRYGFLKKKKRNTKCSHTNAQPTLCSYLSLISYEASSPLNSMGVWIFPG